MKLLLFGLLSGFFFNTVAPSSELEGVEGKWFSTEFNTSIHFLKDGSYKVDGDRDGVVNVTGNYTIEGNTLTLNDASGKMACIGIEGKYDFEIEGDKITFSLKSDPCEGRNQFLDKQTWERDKS